MSTILTLNAGSSSIKFGAYRKTTEPELLLSGQVEPLGPEARLIVEYPKRAERSLGTADHVTGLRAILDEVSTRLGEHEIAGIGHRVVHGGMEFGDPVELTDGVITKLEALVPLAPLHQPNNLAVLHAAKKAFPAAVQMACFDTAFHRGHPFVDDTFALPRRYYEEGVRRYGFHGLSYDYITSVLKRDWPGLYEGRVVVAHLGNGASMCAIHDGRSIGSTMGFSALDGLPMGTRCGQLDPGVLLYLMDQGLTAAEIAQMLYRESGLKGMSELSHDMRTLLASDSPKAAEAIDYFVFRIRRELGAMAAVLQGIDGMVFTGGIGENAAVIRARVVDGMEFLGMKLDPAANAENTVDIGAGKVRTLVIPTDEERVIARAVVRKLDR